MRKISLSSLVALVAMLVIATGVFAAVTFDPATGTGFVGKGDVQLALGLNNAQLQNTTVAFASESTVVSEVNWECTNSNNEKIQERERTTTTSITGVLSSIARVKNQITGFNLNGYSSSTTTSSTEGPGVNTCPNSAGSWTLTTPAGDSVEVSNTSILSVNGVPLQ